MNSLLVLVKAIGAAVIAGGVTHIVIPLLIRSSFKLNFFDTPDATLKSHKQPTPYLGGLGVYIGFLSGLALIFPVENNLWFMMVGITLLLFLGLIDDLIVLRPAQKWWGQVVAACCFMRGGFYLKELFLLTYAPTLIPYLWPLVSIGWILTVINAFNLIDVMDGLAATTAISIAFLLLIAAFIVQAYPVVILLAAFIGALIAFLIWNRPTAHIYLGDSGALCIGGFLATMPFMIPWGTYNKLGFLAPLMIFFVPLAEVGMLILIRSLRGIPFYQGSRDHFCHYLQRKGWSLYKILIFAVAITLLNGANAVAFMTGYTTLFFVVSQGILCGTVWLTMIFYQPISQHERLARS